MPKEHLKFHSEKGKRLLLIADDELINREILKVTLEDEYDFIFAETGLEALEQTQTHSETLSLVLLDLKMPGMSGQEVLNKLKSDEATSNIPVIVLTAEQNAEVESLSLGASDFIQKPYPPADVIKARITRAIELAEDKQIISDTERDHLTGLYNKDYFYAYAHQLDLFHKDRPMDALIIDINNFRMINERYGKAYGDEVLRGIGEKLRSLVLDDEGIVCRREADTYMVYCPHLKSPAEFLKKASEHLIEDDSETMVRLRMGIYANVDKSENIERRFDRAKIAADSVKNNFNNNIGVYDKAMLERELYSDQLVSSFSKAIETEQFTVYYQPKFDITADIPILASAEALVRWQHPELGMISPGVFIPLFEENGLIQELDKYVWRTAARQIKDWRDRFGITIPVSVNVSRIDMYDPHLIETLVDILEENELTTSELLLEITESAYTQDSEQMIDVVNNLRAIGFCIEMDDFGTGYSSLNMISTLPIDALKLDMQFVRNAFKDVKDTRMLEVIIEIAEYLSVPVIAEGIETEEQYNTLRNMGCDMVQGYFFSKPLPSEEYEKFVAERAKKSDVPVEPLIKKKAERKAEGIPKRSIGRIAYALCTGFENVYYVNMDTDHFVEFGRVGKSEDLHMQHSGQDFFKALKENVKECVYPVDQARVILNLEKETLESQIVGNQTFTMTYRLFVDGTPKFYNLKAVRSNNSENHVVIGVSNVDEQVREISSQLAADGENDDYNGMAKALQTAKEIVFRDALTGVKSKHAFAEAEEQWDERMSSDSEVEFAVVICDINDLKIVNDTYGHAAGDKYIKDAAMVICNTFKHSPVYRIGGDEFAAILYGSDYDDRHDLIGQLQKKDVSFASGLSDRLSEDSSFSDVFNRADAAMYANKEAQKK